MSGDDSRRLRHMLDAARKISRIVHGKSRADLDTDETLAPALVRMLEVLGEASKFVSPEFRAAHPEVPWKELAGTRDRLIHGYFDVDLDVVWKIVTLDVPHLAPALEGIVSAIES